MVILIDECKKIQSHHNIKMIGIYQNPMYMFFLVTSMYMLNKPKFNLYTKVTIIITPSILF